MSILRERRRLIAVDHFARQWSENALPSHTVAISFDDAYVDNLTDALPVLERESIPATLFLPTGLIGQASFWWDELAAIVAGSQPLSPVTLRYGDLSWALPAGGVVWDPNWRAWHAPTNVHQHLLVEIWRAIRPLGHDLRSDLLRHWRELVGSTGSPDGRPMTEDELKHYVSRPGISLGAHTVTHVALAEVDRDKARDEMRQSKERTELLAGRPIAGLAYPFGQHSPAIDELMAEAGYEWGLGLDEPWSTNRSRFAVPRLSVPDVDGPSLLRLING